MPSALVNNTSLQYWQIKGLNFNCVIFFSTCVKYKTHKLKRLCIIRMNRNQYNLYHIVLKCNYVKMISNKYKT